MEQVERILQVLGSLEIGGAEVMIMNLYRQIDRSKIQFDFIVHTSRHCFFEDEISRLGGRVYRVPRFSGFNILQYLRAWKDFFRNHPEFRVVHSHVTSSSALHLGIAKQFHLYTIAHSHSVKMFHGIKGVMDRVFSFPTRWIANQFFACSKAAGQARFGRRVVDSCKFTIIKNALDVNRLGYSPDTRETYRKQLNLDGKFVVGHVGRFDAMKNHDFLIRLFSLVHERQPNAVLVLIGDGEQRATIETLIKRFALEDAVKLLGTRSDVVELLQAMDVFVFPSIAEGLGISVIEAQATGLPCIVSSCVPEDVRITGLVKFLDLKDPMEMWVEAILQYVNGHKRSSHFEALTNHGYDVVATAEYLQAFYLNAINHDTRVTR
ncbi:MAG: glycosyltransferase family 1 protein [Sphaerochaeta sp.]|nr:glycosyltransferase family 1 protein [Sphaerochaeta sp.]